MNSQWFCACEYEIAWMQAPLAVLRLAMQASLPGVCGGAE